MTSNTYTIAYVLMILWTVDRDKRNDLPYGIYFDLDEVRGLQKTFTEHPIHRQGERYEIYELRTVLPAT